MALALRLASNGVTVQIKAHFLLALVGASLGISSLAVAGVHSCRAGDVELVDGFGGAGLGHQSSAILIRNRSSQACSLTGVPRLLFFDGHGKRTDVDYGENTGDYLLQPVNVRPITLKPGDFAHFSIGTRSCNDAPGCPSFSRVEIVLPEDSTPLLLRGGYTSVGGFDVTAIDAGPGEPQADGWSLPSARAVIASGSLAGFEASVYVPEHPVQGLPLYVSIKNKRTEPSKVAWKRCVLEAHFRNSTGKVLARQETCLSWQGENDAKGWLAPGSVATMDFDAGVDPFTFCREGRWMVDLKLETSAGQVQLAPLPLEVNQVQCSDSAPPVTKPSEAIKWFFFSRHGVRLGLLLAGNKLPLSRDIRTLTEEEQNSFPAGETIDARLFLDNVTDGDIHFDDGPEAFRLLVQNGGLRTSALDGVPARQQSSGASKTITIPPHTQVELGPRRLTERYDLPPGQYELVAGVLGLTGDAAMANAPATGWPYTNESETVSTLFRVIP